MHLRKPRISRIFSVLLIVVLFPFAGFAGEWEDIFQADGVQVSRKVVPNSDLFAFRGEGVIDAPISTVITVLRDINRAREWMDRASELRTLKINSPTNRTEYYRIAVPFPLQDRDFVYESNLEVDHANKRILFAMKSVEDPAVPPKKGVVRGELYTCRLILTPLDGGARTHAIGEAHTNPKGSIPTWIVNLIQKRWPYNTFTNVRKQIKKGPIEDDALAKQLFAELMADVNGAAATAAAAQPTAGTATSANPTTAKK